MSYPQLVWRVAAVGYDVFLSYRRADQAIARALVEALEARGVGVWWDQKIEAGTDWRDAIVENLVESDMLVILFSEECNASKQLKKEMALADDMDKDVIPVLIEDTKPKGHFLYELAARNWLQVFPNPESKITELADKLTGLAAKSPGGLEGTPTSPAPVSPPPATQVAPAETIAQPTEPLKPAAPPKPQPMPKPAKRKKVKSGKLANEKQYRNYLPFRFMDIFIIGGLLAAASWMGEFHLEDLIDDLATLDFEDMTEWLAFASIGLAGVGAVLFPIRYYMRRLRLKTALIAYTKSSLTLYALLFAAGAWYASMEGEWGEVMMVCLGFGGLWLAFGAVAFIIYAILHFQRTLRSFRSNVESL